MVQLLDVRSATITVGGLRMDGFGQNDAMTVEFADDVLTDIVGADGQAAVSRINDGRMRIGLTFLQTSGAIPLMQSFLEAQHGLRAGIAPTVIAPIPFFYLHPPTGCRIASAYTLFMNRIAPGIGKGIQEVQYRLLLPDPDYEWGTLNVNTLVQP